MKPRLRLMGGMWECFDGRFVGKSPDIRKAYLWWWQCDLNNWQWQPIV